MKDKRYTVTLEYCGYSTPRWVARFCGDWISQHESKESAESACAEHSAARMRKLDI